jgi:shikimate dehydrogenase
MSIVYQQSAAPGKPAGISGRTRIVGVWGHPVAHSRSPAMHNAALRELGLDWAYLPFDVHPDRVGAAVAGIRALDLIGVNVTVPLKEKVIAHLDVVDPTASRIGSVNTIHNVGGELRGYSTDGPGFIGALESMGWPVEKQTVYMLGAGGSARALAFALAERGNRVLIANRSPDRAEGLAAAVNAAYVGTAAAIAWNSDTVGEPIDIVVNTTSQGMHPLEHECPSLPSGVLKTGMRVYDLIYAPEETLLLKKAREAGCVTANGLGMLAHQGALSLSIWSGIAIDMLPLAIMESAARRAG